MVYIVFMPVKKSTTKTKTKTKTAAKPKNLFKPGQSGNPSGRKKGTKNKATIIREAIESNMVEHIEGEAMAVLQKTIDMAKDGDTTCIKILMDRLWPTNRGDKKLEGIDKSKIVINVAPLEAVDYRREPIEIKAVPLDKKEEK